MVKTDLELKTIPSLYIGNEETQTAQIIFVNKDAEYPTPAVTPATAVVHPNCPPALKIPDHVPNNTDDGDDAPISPRHDASSYGI